MVQESLARDLEKEVASLEEHAQGMQEQSAKTDAALRVSKDQYLRLTADFENFRKRSVCFTLFLHIQIFQAAGHMERALMPGLLSKHASMGHLSSLVHMRHSRLK